MSSLRSCMSCMSRFVSAAGSYFSASICVPAVSLLDKYLENSSLRQN